MNELEVPRASRRAFSGAYESPPEDLDDLVAIRAIAKPVVVAYLRRLAMLQAEPRYKTLFTYYAAELEARS